MYGQQDPLLAAAMKYMLGQSQGAPHMQPPAMQPPQQSPQSPNVQSVHPTFLGGYLQRPPAQSGWNYGYPSQTPSPHPLLPPVGYHPSPTPAPAPGPAFLGGPMRAPGY
jgi:hypothetical protein